MLTPSLLVRWHVGWRILRDARPVVVILRNEESPREALAVVDGAHDANGWLYWSALTSEKGAYSLRFARGFFPLVRMTV
jgi:hypothetical protein